MDNRYTIEPFVASDAMYEACARINNAIYPEYPDLAADWKRHDEKRDTNYYRNRLMARDSETDELVAFGQCDQASWTTNKHVGGIEVWAHPDHQGRGIGSALYQQLLDDLTQQMPINHVEGTLRSDHPRALRFAERWGAELSTREYASKLELALFDPTPFQAYVARVEASSVELLDLNQIEARDPDDWTVKLHELLTDVMRDVPWHEPLQAIPYDVWIEKFRDHPSRIPETYLIAVDGDQYVGVTMITKRGKTMDSLFTGLTGVRRSHRRRGLTVALKVKSLNYAKEHFRAADGSLPSVMTENEENNPMYLINERLGFVRQPDWMTFVKKLN